MPFTREVCSVFGQAFPHFYVKNTRFYAHLTGFNDGHIIRIDNCGK